MAQKKTPLTKTTVGGVRFESVLVQEKEGNMSIAQPCARCGFSGGSHRESITHGFVPAVQCACGGWRTDDHERAWVRDNVCTKILQDESWLDDLDLRDALATDLRTDCIRPTPLNLRRRADAVEAVFWRLLNSQRSLHRRAIAVAFASWWRLRAELEAVASAQRGRIGFDHA